MDRIDAAIIGAGVIGIAVARALSLAGRSVVILEREAQFGTGVSSRNSEVIHAGIHYPHGSLKERLCIEGKRLLYEYCESHHIPHRRCGKLTFAASENERARLEAIARHAHESGADEDLAVLEGHEVTQIEASLHCAAALLSPSSGIVDANGYMLSLLGEAEDHGAMLARKAPAERIERVQGGWRVHAAGTALDCAMVVNAAGLEGWAVAENIDALDRRYIPARHLAKGSYFTYTGMVPFSRLIYPLPVGGGLGVHLTLDMGGQARFGPDLEWVDEVDTTVDPCRHAEFLASARQFWPDIDPGKLVPGYCGIRPKIVGPGEGDADFLIQGEETHTLPGLVNLFGIETPGLTSSLAIAQEVAARLEL
jgi:L-2-hydroxyglutarate oxidase LhgO